MSPARQIEDALARHGTAVLAFSGGKDSIAVLHHCRPWAARITVVYVALADAFPHVRRDVERLCDLWDFKLHVVESAPPADTLPTDLLPVWSTPFAAWFLAPSTKPQTPLISALDCCRLALWEPLAAQIRALGTTLVVRGSKAHDEHVSVPSGFVAEGIEYLNPLWDWSDTEVYFYLQEQGIDLPHQYRVGVNHSLDCATCTGWLNTPAEVQRIAYTQTYYPAQFQALQHRMTQVLAETQRRSAELIPALDAVFPAAPDSVAVVHPAVE